VELSPGQRRTRSAGYAPIALSGTDCCQPVLTDRDPLMCKQRGRQHRGIGEALGTVEAGSLAVGGED